MATAARASADVGLIGLAVMGQNLNMADHRYRVAVYNRITAVMERFVAGHGDTPGGLVGAAALPDFVGALKKPRKILILVKAGAPVDAVVEQLLGVGVEPDDIVVDCGDSLWTDTIRRLVRGGKLMARVLIDYLTAIGWGVAGAVSLAVGLGILLRVVDWLTPIDEWEEIKKGNTSVAIIMAAVILALGIAIGFAIMPVPATR